MKMPGTPFDTHDRTGAPGEAEAASVGIIALDAVLHVPMVMLGTKWLASGAISVSGFAGSGRAREAEGKRLPVHHICSRHGASAMGRRRRTGRRVRSGGLWTRRWMGAGATGLRSPMCSHSAPPRIMRLHSAVS